MSLSGRPVYDPNPLRPNPNPKKPVLGSCRVRGLGRTLTPLSESSQIRVDLLLSPTCAVFFFSFFFFPFHTWFGLFFFFLSFQIGFLGLVFFFFFFFFFHVGSGLGFFILLFFSFSFFPPSFISFSHWVFGFGFFFSIPFHRVW